MKSRIKSVLLRHIKLHFHADLSITKLIDNLKVIKAILVLERADKNNNENNCVIYSTI
jgi:hypothetical protein